MKRYLILWACAVAVCGYAGLATSAVSAARTARDAKEAVPPRHLSDTERAELRRQLEQFNRSYGKRS